jgi:hypothetical protein
MEAAVRQCLRSGVVGLSGLDRRATQCIAPTHGWLRVRVLRCVNLVPIGDDLSSTELRSASCTCWIAGSAEAQETTLSADCDALGIVRFALPQDLWLPLPTLPATLVVEMRLGTHGTRAAGTRKEPSLLACGVGHVELAHSRCDDCWLRVAGTGPLRSDGENVGGAEVRWCHPWAGHSGAASEAAIAHRVHSALTVRVHASPAGPLVLLDPRGAVCRCA